MDGIKQLNSYSIEGRSSIIAKLDPDQTTEAEAKDDIQDVVDRLSELPEGAEDPVVTSLDTKLNPVIEIAVAGDLPKIELRNIAKAIEDELETVDGVARVEPKGMRDIEIRVEANPRKLANYRLSLDNLIQALKGQNVSIPGGSVEVGPNNKSGEKIVRTTGEFESLEDVRNTVIRANDVGQAVKISDVATVRYDLEKTSVLNKTNGIPSISLTVLKKERSDAIVLVDDVKEKVEELKAKYEGQVEFSYINDMSDYIRRRLSVLSSNLVVGLTFVLIILSLILPLRVALLVSLGIPFAFFGAMIYFYQFGYTINLVSLLGLIIVTGMLVDDAVVVTDNAYRKMEEGLPPEEAAIKGAQEIWPSLTASVFTTIIAFVPMLFMSGVFGKFVKQIPLGVIIPLFASLIEGFFILPSHISRWIRYRKAQPNNHSGIRRALAKSQHFWEENIVPAYLRGLDRILRRRYLLATGILAIFIGSILLAVFGMRFILFPPRGIEIFFVKMETDAGYSLEQTMEAIKPVERVIRNLPDNEIKDFTSTVGLVQQDPNDPNTQRGNQYAMIQVFLEPESHRARKADEIIEAVKASVGPVPEFRNISYEMVKPGPPVGKPISVGVRGKDYNEILAAVEDLKNFVATIPHVSDISDTYVPGKEEYRVILNKNEAAASSLNVATVGTTVRAAYEGIVATNIQKLDEEIAVRVSLPPEDRTTKQALESLFILNPMGSLIPLDRIARIDETVGIASYEHEASQRQVKVVAEVDAEKSSSTEANNIIRKHIPELKKQHPNINFYFGGEDEDTKESMQSLFRAFLLAVLGIFFMLILIFQNIYQPFLILFTIPLGLVSVVVAFYLHGLPLSFFAMLGIVALAGVIVNNAIVLVDFVNTARKEGHDRMESIRVAAKRRIRPIFLTTLTTVVGLMPTAYGIGGKDEFVVPIALAIAWGLVFGSLLTIFAFPAAIAILDDFVELLKRQFAKYRS